MFLIHAAVAKASKRAGSLRIVERLAKGEREGQFEFGTPPILPPHATRLLVFKSYSFERRRPARSGDGPGTNTNTWLTTRTRTAQVLPHCRSDDALRSGVTPGPQELRPSSPFGGLSGKQRCPSLPPTPWPCCQNYVLVVCSSTSTQNPSVEDIKDK